ncbi:hypothetical protein EJB05_26261, partial [Eragrostis curvula]
MAMGEETYKGQFAKFLYYFRPNLRRLLHPSPLSIPPPPAAAALSFVSAAAPWRRRSSASHPAPPGPDTTTPHLPAPTAPRADVAPRRVDAAPPGHHHPAPSSSASAAASGSSKRGGGGLLLGRYELGRLLGHGTFAKVYHARHADTGESVAIKVLDKEKALRHGLVPHIKREIAILRCVRHPNIVRLFEVMATKSKIYFVMELVRGGELFARVAKGRLKEDTARRYFQQLISAVALAAETAAALAAGSIVFRESDPAYSKRLLDRAVAVFEFADKHRGAYSSTLHAAVCPCYCDFSGYQDELLWGAAWLHKEGRRWRSANPSVAFATSAMANPSLGRGCDRRSAVPREEGRRWASCRSGTPLHR